MKVYARTNTGDPRTGFIGVGEVLTGKQREALGEEKIQELIQRGVLGVIREEAPAEKPEPPTTAPEAPDAPEETQEEEGPEENEEELPELEISADLVGEAEKAPKSSAKKTGGRRK